MRFSSVMAHGRSLHFLPPAMAGLILGGRDPARHANACEPEAPAPSGGFALSMPDRWYDGLVGGIAAQIFSGSSFLTARRTVVR